VRRAGVLVRLLFRQNTVSFWKRAISLSEAEYWFDGSKDHLLIQVKLPWLGLLSGANHIQTQAMVLSFILFITVNLGITRDNSVDWANWLFEIMAKMLLRPYYPIFMSLSDLILGLLVFD
jgi:hypothetical protein